MSPSLLASIALTIALFAYIFWPERNPFVQADKTRVDYLRERKEAIYENLRDLTSSTSPASIPRPTTTSSAARSKTRPPKPSPRWKPSPPAV